MLLYLYILLMIVQQLSFKEAQLKHSRVKAAYEEKESVVKKYFEDKGASFSRFQIFIRAFKKEQKLEVWIKQNSKDTYELLTTYDFCTTSGTLGPKRKEGDLQIPEGIYQLNHFNPLSNFHLSLGVSYPNSSDRILSDQKRPGGSIYIHGNCVTIGCIPITDDKIKELYILAVEARNNGQQKIPIHIFPARLTDDGFASLKKDFISPEMHNFWQNLKTIFHDFETTKKLKTVSVDQKGAYYF